MVTDRCFAIAGKNYHMRRETDDNCSVISLYDQELLLHDCPLRCNLPFDFHDKLRG